MSSPPETERPYSTRSGFPRPCIVGAGLAPAHLHQLKKRDDKTRLHLRRYQQYERSDINRQRSLVMSSVTYVGTRLKAILEEDAKRLARETGCIKRERKFTGADLV